MKLYMSPTSGNAYKVRLLLAMLNLPYEKAILEFKTKEHKQPGFLKLSPRGQVPVLEDGERTFWDSTACLVYLARKHGGENWLPTDPAGIGRAV
jgi:glutathione S-transferase